MKRQTIFKLAVLIGLIMITGCETTETRTGVPQPYNLTMAGNATDGYVQLMQSVNNNILGGLYGFMIMLTIGLIAYMAFMVGTAHSGKSMAGALFVSFAVGILLLAMDILPSWAIYGCLGLFVLAVVFLKQID